MNFEIQLIGLALGIYLFIVLQFLYFQRKNRNELKQQLKKEWGNFSEKEFDHFAFQQRIHNYQTSYSAIIDDITWNDLDMDSIFRQMNQTQSSIGEEYLYNLLHIPITDLKILQEREHLITFFTEHEKERLSFQILAKQIGKQKKETFSDFLYYTKELPKLNIVKHLISAFFLIGSIFLLFFYPVWGIFAFIFALIYGISFYYKEKAKAANYIAFFTQTVYLLKAIDQLKEFRAAELKPYLDPMIHAQEKLVLFKRLSSVLLGSGTSGSPIDILLDYIRMLTHIDLILFGKIAAQFETYKSDITLCIEQFGFLESMIAAASYRKALPNYCQPQFLLKEKSNMLSFTLTKGYHPCIKKPVDNSISVKKSVLLTGSNASGKSTFLKMAAIAAILAQTINTVPAAKYQAPFYQIYSSMAIRDNLSDHDSYYMAEIKSLKRILDAKKDRIPVLCFIDEVLRGTNTVERIAASTEILKNLSKQQVLCFAATHDVELTKLLDSEYENYYFSEQIQKEDILFDYKLKKGTSTSRNAIRLIQQIGYDKKIVDNALLRVDLFLKTGNWKEI